MSVSTNQNRFTQVGDGANTTFNYPSYFKSKQDIKVSVTLVDDDGNIVSVNEKILDTDYGIAGAVTAGFGYVNGAAINFNVAPSDKEIVVLVGDPNQLQNTVLAPNSVYPPVKIESTFDAIVLMLQRIADVLFSRTVALKDGMIDAFDPTLPIDIASVENRGKAVIVDPDGGNKFVMGPTVQTPGVSLESVDVTGGDEARVLPAAADNGGKIVGYVNSSIGSANKIDVSTTGGDNVHGQATDQIFAGEVRQYWSDGVSGWWIIN